MRGNRHLCTQLELVLGASSLIKLKYLYEIYTFPCHSQGFILNSPFCGSEDKRTRGWDVLVSQCSWVDYRGKGRLYLQLGILKGFCWYLSFSQLPMRYFLLLWLHMCFLHATSL